LDKKCTHGENMKINFYKCDYDLKSRYSYSFTETAHAHEGVEIIYLKKGTSHTFINGEEYILSPGDAFIIFPNCVHYHKESESIEAVLLSFPVKTLPEFYGVFSKKTPVSPLIRYLNPIITVLLEDLVRYEGKYKAEAQKGLLLATVSMILENISLSERNIAENTNIGAILEYCAAHYTENITIQSVAEALNISKSYISHAFTYKIQMCFRDYINSLRLRHALKLLKEERLNVTEIAYEIGFSTIRTFNRVFKKKFNISPLQYKKQCAKMSQIQAS